MPCPKASRLTVGRPPRLVVPFGARPAPGGRAGVGLGQKKSAVPTADPPAYHHSPETPSPHFEISNPHTINKIPHPYHLTLPPPCYSGLVRAPAFRERQTGASRPGPKSSPRPPSVSRSTDCVTQDNGIDPKPFWRLRAIPKELHLIKPYPGRPLGAAPGCWGHEIGRPNGRFPSFWPLQPFARTALRHGFGMESLALRTLFTTPANRCHRLFTLFLLAISTAYVPRPLLTPHPSRMLVRGPESEILEG